MYPEELVSPMRKQLTDQGFSELKSEDDVNKMISNKGTTLVVVNSVCGCAAANARPGAITSLVNDKKPDQLTTVFAGVDRDAVEKVRYYLAPFPPSSPAIALFKDGELVVKDGEIIKVVWGKTHTAKPAYDKAVEKGLKDYFDKYHTIQLDNFKISDDEIAQDGRNQVINHTK